MTNLFKLIAFSCCLALPLIGSGCSHSQVATEPYPIWGESIFLPVENGESRRHMQIRELSQSADDIQACILIVHGMNEHTGRYAEIARHFAQSHLVAGIDMTAHGLSNPVYLDAHESLKAGADEFDVGSAFLEQAQLRNLDAMRADLHLAIRHLRQRCDKSAGDDKPLVILSHSLGSLVSASYLLEAKLQDTVDGIIFTGPAFAVTEVPGWRGWFQNPLIRFTYHTQEHFLHPHDEAFPLMLFNQFTALLTVPLQNSIIEFLSLPGMRNIFSPSNPDWVAAYLSDWEVERLRHKHDRYIMHRSILRYVQGVQKEIIRFRRNMADFDTPYLLIYSEYDPITAAWGNIDFAAVTLEKHPLNEVMPLIGKSHHEQLFSEPRLRREVLDKIDRWLESLIAEHKQPNEY
ncbi:alpha/beta fold hydrolase [Methylotuvimicrobium buryatense]|uniref:Alpha/beta fold hydrolase n=1 Tax=Methylotuvimicrobium buryatense TaxID=95641 RepID=A0A4P9UPD8_METBY|nr:alpha/beta fold hydrolase [Methylotuvimicrobium buryatense]QCW83218.1 alpha/beta fold hydrolase [Methylotuvimicrobium buryatense]